MGTTLPRTFESIVTRLRAAGYDWEALEPCLVPEWWDEACKREFIPELEFEVARLLACPIEVLRDPQAPLPRREELSEQNLEYLQERLDAKQGYFDIFDEE